MSQFGYLCPLSSNVADFAMDVLAGFVAQQVGAIAGATTGAKAVSTGGVAGVAAAAAAAWSGVTVPMGGSWSAAGESG